MNFKQIEYFLAFAETLSFTSAANQMGVSQPALTRAIKNLEDSLGGQLVHRDGKDTRLTTLGYTLHEEFATIMTSVVRARDRADALVQERSVTITVGIAPTLSPFPIMDFLWSSLADKTNVECKVQQVSEAQAPNLVLSGAIDMCFCEARPDMSKKLIRQKLYKERLFIGLPARHRLASNVKLRPHDLKSMTFLERFEDSFREHLVTVFGDDDEIPISRMRTDREDFLQYAVANNRGFAVFPEYAQLRPDVCLRPLEGAELIREIGFLGIFGSATSLAVKQLYSNAQSFDWPAQ